MGRSVGWNEILYLLKAIPWTLLLSAGALVGGGLIGLLISVLRVAPSRALRWLATSYIELFQGTPVLMQLFVTYYGLAVLFDIQVGAWPAVLIAFTLYSGAFLGEIWRGAIQAIPKPQWEAAECLSLGFLQQLRYVILPQAARISIPPTVGFAVQLIKNTSIAAIRPLEPVDAAEQRRLAGPAAPDDRHDLARLDREGDAVERLVAPEALRDVS